MKALPQAHFVLRPSGRGPRRPSRPLLTAITFLGAVLLGSVVLFEGVWLVIPAR